MTTYTEEMVRGIDGSRRAAWAKFYSQREAIVQAWAMIHVARSQLHRSRRVDFALAQLAEAQRTLARSGMSDAEFLEWQAAWAPRRENARSCGLGWPTEAGWCR